MASGTRQDNTMAEGLRKLLGDISDLKLAADADLPFLINLETMILGKLKGGAQDALQTGQPGGQMGGMPPGMGSPGMPQPVGGMGAMAAPPPGMGSPPGVPGLMQGPNIPNPDELRRVLTRANTANRLNDVSSRISNAIK